MSRLLLFGGKSYADKILSYNPIAYWPQWETQGTTAQDLVNSPAQDGAYTGVTLNALAGPDGNPTPFYDGANDYTNIYTATLAGAFDGSEGTVAVWVRVANAGVWTDTILRTIAELRVDSSNFIDIYHNGAGSLLYRRRAGGAGVGANAVVVAGAPTTWIHTVNTWSVTSNELCAYYNGALAAGPIGLGGVWAGMLSATQTCIGALSTAPTWIWHGYLAHVVLFDRALSPTEVADLAVV